MTRSGVMMAIQYRSRIKTHLKESQEKLVGEHNLLLLYARVGTTKV